MSGAERITILRPGAIYGRYDHPHLLREWYLVGKVARGERELWLPAGGTQLFHRVAVDRGRAVAAALARAPAEPIVQRGLRAVGGAARRAARRSGPRAPAGGEHGRRQPVRRRHVPPPATRHRLTVCPPRAGDGPSLTISTCFRRVNGGHGLRDGDQRAQLGHDLGGGLDRADGAGRLARVERHRLDRAGRARAWAAGRRSAGRGSRLPASRTTPTCSSASASAASIELRSTRCGPARGSPTLNAVADDRVVGRGGDHRLDPRRVRVGLGGGDEARADAHAVRARPRARRRRRARSRSRRPRSRAPSPRRAPRRAAAAASGPRSRLRPPDSHALAMTRSQPAASAARASSADSTCQPHTAPPARTSATSSGSGVGQEEVDVRHALDGELERLAIHQRDDEVDAARAARGAERARPRRAPRRQPPAPGTSVPAGLGDRREVGVAETLPSARAGSAARTAAGP